MGKEKASDFESEVDLRQSCVMFPGLFNIYTDGVVREMYARAEGNRVNLFGGGWLRMGVVRFCLQLTRH